MLKFEWDKEKAQTNLSKHGVSFEEAATAFSDDLHLAFEDPDHSIDEARFLLFGISALSKYLAVSYTERGDTIRIISARRMSRRERSYYEQ